MVWVILQPLVCGLLFARDLDPTLHCLQDDRVGVSIPRATQPVLRRPLKGEVGLRSVFVTSKWPHALSLLARQYITPVLIVLYAAGTTNTRAFWRIVASISAIAKRDIGARFLRRDTQVSIAYSDELIFPISATLQSPDRHHGIVGQERCHFQLDS